MNFSDTAAWPRVRQLQATDYLVADGDDADDGLGVSNTAPRQLTQRAAYLWRWLWQLALDVFRDASVDDSYAGVFTCGVAWSPTGYNPLKVIAGTSGEIQVSYDGGPTFNHVDAAASYSGTFTDAAIVGDSLVLVGTGGAIQRSTNGATSFSAISPDASYSGDFNAVVAVDGVLVAVGDNGEIQRSTNGGASFSHVAAAGSYSGNFNGVAALDGILIAVGTGGEIQRSADLGVSWASIAHGLGSGELLDVAANGDSFCASRLSSTLLSEATDEVAAGLAWSVSSVAAAGGTNGLSGGPHVFVTQRDYRPSVSFDGGATFQDGRLWTAEVVSYVVVGDAVLAFGVAGEVFVSQHVPTAL